VCRNIKVLFNFEPPASDEEIRSAAEQYVRKISGFARPSAANEESFDRAIDEVARVSAQLLGSLQTNAAPRNRDVEAARRMSERFAGSASSGSPLGARRGPVPPGRKVDWPACASAVRIHRPRGQRMVQLADDGLPLALLATYAALSLVLFALYGIDKAAARAGRRRIPESTLHLISLAGGWPGAMVGQRVFRHKTQKQPFKTIYRLTVVANCIALAWLFWSWSAIRG